MDNNNENSDDYQDIENNLNRSNISNLQINIDDSHLSNENYNSFIIVNNYLYHRFLSEIDNPNIIPNTNNELETNTNNININNEIETNTNNINNRHNNINITNELDLIEEEIDNKTEITMNECVNNIFNISEDFKEVFNNFYLEMLQYHENINNILDDEENLNSIIRNTILLMINRTLIPLAEIISTILNYSLTSNNYMFVNNYDKVYEICREEIKRFLRISLRYVIIRNMMNNLAENRQMDDVKLVMKEDEIEKIKKINYDNTLNKENEKCAICLEDFKKNDDCRELKCKHIYHINCIDNWLLKHSYKCPCCREGAGEYYYNYE